MTLESITSLRATFPINLGFVSAKGRERSFAGRMNPTDVKIVRAKMEDVNSTNAPWRNEERGPVAKRALEIIGGDKSVEPYYKGWHEAQSNAYDAVLNPGGCIQLGLSENKLSLDLLEQWFSTHNTAPAPEFEDSLNFKAIAGYPDVYHGLFVFRKLIAKFMDGVYGGSVAFSPEKMVITTGATSAIEILAFCLADPGDAFLVPAPYYPGFDRDIKFRSQVELVPVPGLSENEFSITTAGLEQAFEESENRGKKVKAILMTSPSNPLGKTYTQDELLMILDFVREKGIHLICDEIYAGSVFGTSKFVSIAELVLAPPFDPSQVHIIYGLSKILGIPGFRVGLLYTWNDQVLDAAKMLTRFTSVPTLTQQILVSLLSDTQFLHLYLSENQKRLRARWDFVKHALQDAGLPFIPCTAGFYCWVNIGQIVGVTSREQEQELWRKLLYEVGVNVTLGSACQCTEPGWFRLCFAFVDDKTMAVALDRIKQFCDSVRQDSRCF